MSRHNLTRAVCDVQAWTAVRIAHARTRDDWTRAAGTAAACVRIARIADDLPAQAFGERCERYARRRERAA